MAAPRFAPFDTLLIANRGEIACRVIRSARAMGIRTIAVYSDADRNARHVALADQAVFIGAAPVAASYLNIDAIVQAARRAGAQAVHPGYGLLSENPLFAQACANADLVFVGPSASAMKALGNKAQAKRIAQALGIPSLGQTLGGGEADTAHDAPLTERSHDDPAGLAQRTGYPLLIKAAAGGGGRGMRRVNGEADLLPALRAARQEALAAFGSDEILMEPWIESARHVEIQVLADSYGYAVHLGERDCSTQRRHQKIIEEAPAPDMSDALRDDMGNAALALVRHAEYVGAGTVEFLLGGDGRFHFLEMNTRLQVEHTVTEMITGLDLVALQLQIAAGQALPFSQSDIRFSGHAIQARVCAEDPWQDFIPQAGDIGDFKFPATDAGLRIDHGLQHPASVSRHYDSMIAKVIAHANDRDSAIRRLKQGLADTRLPGLRTNLAFLAACLDAEPFRSGQLHTQWLTMALPTMQRQAASSPWIAAAAALLVWQASRVHGELAGFANGAGLAAPVRLAIDTQELTGRIEMLDTCHFRVSLGAHGKHHHVAIMNDTRVEVDGVSACCKLERLAGAGNYWFDLGGEAGEFVDMSERASGREARAGDGRIRATMHGQIAAVLVAIGDQVEAGQHLLSLEAMKMEHRMVADSSGVVSACLVKPGDQVAPGAELVTITASGEPD